MLNEEIGNRNVGLGWNLHGDANTGVEPIKTMKQKSHEYFSLFLGLRKVKYCTILVKSWGNLTSKRMKTFICA